MQESKGQEAVRENKMNVFQTSINLLIEILKLMYHKAKSSEHS